jgi:hypothetical protein
MRSLVRLFAVALVGTITFGSMVHAAEAPANPANPSVSSLSEAYRASDKVLVLPVEVVPEGVPADKTKRCPQWEDEFAEFGLPVQTFSYIAYRESRCNPLAHNKTLNRNGSQDRGLVQINSGWVTVTAKECASQRGDLSVLFNVRCNLAVARYLYRNGGLRHWNL